MGRLVGSLPHQTGHNTPARHSSLAKGRLVRCTGLYLIRLSFKQGAAQKCNCNDLLHHTRIETHSHLEILQLKVMPFWSRNYLSHITRWMDGWVKVLHPFQQYFNHFEMMEGWTWKAVCNEVPFRFGKNIASSGIGTRDLKSGALTAQPRGRFIHITTKPVSGVCDQITLKSACSATETS